MWRVVPFPPFIPTYKAADSGIYQVFECLDVCVKLFSLTYSLPFLKFCPKITPMDITIEIDNVVAHLVIPEHDRIYYILEGIDSHE
ncbi:unnamed protein product [Rotaria sp. Silwood1]|nr:unnamed protein product [Rotaria sp. Silwood1]